MNEKVIYPGPYPAVTLPDGTECVQGEPVEVPVKVAEDLIRQGFKPFKESKGGK